MSFCFKCTDTGTVRILGSVLYIEIDDKELDVFVRTILALLPNSGEVMIRGALRGRGVRIQRSRLRESVQRVDPTRKQRRQRLQIRRRVYKVPGPNSLW